MFCNLSVKAAEEVAEAEFKTYDQKPYIRKVKTGTKKFKLPRKNSRKSIRGE